VRNGGENQLKISRMAIRRINESESKSVAGHGEMSAASPASAESYSAAVAWQWRAGES